MKFAFRHTGVENLENNSQKKGLLKAMLTDCGMNAYGRYWLSAKNRADPAGNSSKTCCLAIIFRIQLHHSHLGMSVKHYRSIVKQKTECLSEIMKF